MYVVARNCFCCVTLNSAAVEVNAKVPSRPVPLAAPLKVPSSNMPSTKVLPASDEKTAIVPASPCKVSLTKPLFVLVSFSTDAPETSNTAPFLMITAPFCGSDPGWLMVILPAL